MHCSFSSSLGGVQTSNSVDISLPAIRFTPPLSAQLPALAPSWPLRMLRISLLIRLAQAMACRCSWLLEELLLMLLCCSVTVSLLPVLLVELTILDRV